MNALLQVTDLTKTFTAAKGETADRVLAVDDVSLTVEEGQMYTLLGPSGCGKTTTLRSIAGLEQPTEGFISVAGRTLYSSAENVNLRPDERGLGMVFQSYAIWPHMDVFKNVAFPLQVQSRRHRPSRAAISERVMRVLEVVQLDHLARRPATDLSGGQQQRLALARAIVLEPPLLLLDEPLSNLDAKLREEMRFELKRLQSELQITSVYVTHDQSEALAMSDVIAVMNQGRLEQVGSPRDVYNNPASLFVASFIGTSNFFQGRVVGREGTDAYTVDTAAGLVIASSAGYYSTGDTVQVGIRPEYVEVRHDEAGQGGAVDRSRGGNERAGTVVGSAFEGEAVTYLVRCQTGEDVYAKCNPRTQLSVGDAVTLFLPRDHCYLVADPVSNGAANAEAA